MDTTDTTGNNETGDPGSVDTGVVKQKKARRGAQDSVWAGKPLILAIRRECVRRGLSLKQAHKEIGISYVYLTFLNCGSRLPSQMDIEKKRHLAKWLGISMIELLLLTEELRPSDLVQNATEDELRQQVREVIERNPNDWTLQSIASDLDRTPRSVLLAILAGHRQGPAS